MTDWHICSGSNVVAFPGVRVRRRLQENMLSKWRKPPRPPRGRYGKAAQEKPPPYERHPHHKNKNFDELRTWQQAAYRTREVGEDRGCLTNWEMDFCWSIAAQRRPLSEKQCSKLHNILEKVDGLIDWDED